MTTPANLITNELCGNDRSLSFWVASMYWEPKVNRSYSSNLTSFSQRVLDKGSFCNFAFWNLLFCLELAPFTFHSLFLSHLYFNTWVLNQQNSDTFVSKFCKWYSSWWWQPWFFASRKGLWRGRLKTGPSKCSLVKRVGMWPHGHSFNWRGLSWLGNQFHWAFDTGERD